MNIRKGFGMRTFLLDVGFLFFALVGVGAAEDKPLQAETDPPVAREIGRAISQLNDDRAAERDAAEKKLLELAGKSTAEADRFLEALPKDTEQMPVAVRERLTSIRKQVEDRAAKAATGATTITLSAKGMPLSQVIAAIEKQTGNRFIDNRDQQGDDANFKGAQVDIELKGENFWPAVDKILDQVKLGI